MTGALIQGLVIAGGRGARMLYSTPKPMVRLGNATLIEHAVGRLLRAGVRKIHFALSYEARQIIAFLEKALPPAVEPRWLIEDQPCGTIGSLARLKESGGTTLITNADLATDLDLGGLLRSHRKQAADLTIAVHVESHTLEFGEVLVDSGGQVRAYLEKPTKHYQMSSGMYAAEDSVSELIGDGEKLGIPELVQRALDDGLSVKAYAHKARWLDVNDASTLARALALSLAHPEGFLSPQEALDHDR